MHGGAFELKLAVIDAWQRNAILFAWKKNESRTFRRPKRSGSVQVSN
jgi:hypothetical protein